MLIRFVVNNFFSFGKEKEFNMLPRPRLSRLSNHKYNLLDFDILKLSSIYGANGAGKSNFVKSLDFLQSLVLDESSPYRIEDTKFKFDDKKKPQMLAVEFIENNTAFYYGIEITDNIITTEELYESGLGLKKDKLLFVRRTDKNKLTTINFLQDFENDEKSQVLKSVLIEEFIQPTKPILKLISKRDNVYLQPIKNAFNWFRDSLNIISPRTRPAALAQRLEVDNNFKKLAEDIMCSYNVGIKSITSDKQNITEFFGSDNEGELDEIIKKVEESPLKMIGLFSNDGNELVVVKENDKIYVKIINLEHIGLNNKVAKFLLNEESDGTIRLLDFIPAFQDIVFKQKVYIIDEIERSIHPLLVKELIEKFSSDDNTKGQLIFTTHESNLLDQKIFRQDEIWFTEKDDNGVTDIYSLSDYKEHNTTDIRKGYLNGRYGAIPFLANLQDINWHKYVIDESII